ncbi:hypothetical protein B0H19DRAFT_1270309 [Mycena capillaripes]|nr:hypothetical protein B0H19DRAFT_1270309 [Mycena capillaripes]
MPSDFSKFNESSGAIYLRRPDVVGLNPVHRTHLCGFDLNLTYPQSGHFPTLNLIGSTSNSVLSESLFNPTEDRARTLHASVSSRFAEVHGRDALSKRSDLHQRRKAENQQWKSDLSGRANGTIDPFYGCFLLDELINYAVNFTFPWSNGEFDVYDVPDATNQEPFKNASTFFNDNRTRAALHSPTSKDWIRNFNYPFGSVHNRSRGNQYGDPSVEPIAFLSDLATNAMIIQNMTFGSAQGFTRKPSTPWFDDDGNFAGIVHQERGVNYLLFDGAVHLVPLWKPSQSLVFQREFVLGSNLNGTVSGNNAVVGGENTTLANDFLQGGEEIFFGSSTTAGTSTIPAATRSAWASFTATATASQALLGSNTNRASQESASVVAGVIACFLVCAMLS